MAKKHKFRQSYSDAERLLMIQSCISRTARSRQRNRLRAELLGVARREEQSRPRHPSAAADNEPVSRPRQESAMEIADEASGVSRDVAPESTGEVLGVQFEPFDPEEDRGDDPFLDALLAELPDLDPANAAETVSDAGPEATEKAVRELCRT